MNSKPKNEEFDTSLWSSRVKDISPYVPGEQSSTQTLLKLNTNENPFPPSKLVKEAIIKELQHGADNLRLYPDPDCKAVREAAAAYHGLRPEEVFVGNGSDDVLAHVFYALFDPGKSVLTSRVTYGFYPVYAERFGLELERAPLDDEFYIDYKQLKGDHSGIIFANPNAQTGSFMRLEEIETVLRANADKVVVVDEAYVDFAHTHTEEDLIESKLQPSEKAVQAALRARKEALERNASVKAAPESGNGAEVVEGAEAAEAGEVREAARAKSETAAEGGANAGAVAGADGDPAAPRDKKGPEAVILDEKGEVVDSDDEPRFATEEELKLVEKPVFEIKEIKLIEDRYKGVTAIPLIRRYPNLVVVQTMSKSRSLAGLRIGFAFAQRHLIEALNRSRHSFNSYPVSRLSQVAAIASFEDDDYFHEQCRKVVQQRLELRDELEDMGFDVLPSFANFLMVKHRSIKSHQLFELLKNNYIMVRHFDDELIGDYVRITVGSKSQNKLLLQEIRKIIKKRTGVFSKIGHFFKRLFT